MTSGRPVQAGAARTSWAHRGWGLVRRHPYFTSLIVLVVAIRVALPYVLRPVLEDQISALLDGHIEVDDVDLSLLRGEVVLEGVRIYQGENDGVVSFATLLANVGWTALASQQVVVEQIHLISPQVRVVRERDGEINLTRLPAPVEAAAQPEEVEPEPEIEEESGGWPAGLTLFALEDATIVFSDRTIENFEDIEFNVELLQVERAAYGGPIYEDDGKITLVAEIAGAPLKIEADFASEVLSATSTGNFHVRDLNVGLGSRYAAQLLGWSDLRGALDVDLDFAAESGDAESPRVALALRDFSIAVEGEGEPALQWDSLDVAIQMADPQERFVRVSEIRLTNPAVRVRPAAEQPLVLLSRMDRAAVAAGEEAAGEEPAAAVAAAREGEADSAGSTSPPAAEDAAAAAAAAREGEADSPALQEGPSANEAETAEGAAEAGPAFDGPEPAAPEAVPAEVAGESAPRWELDKLVIEGARILLEAPETTLDVGVGVELTGLSSEAGDKANLVVEAALAGGTLDVGGEIGIAPASFDGGIELADLSVPTVLAMVSEPRAKILRGGIARTDLDLSILVKEGEDAAAVDATVSGTLGIAGLEVADEDPRRFSFKWEDLDVAIDGIDVRDGVPAADGGRVPIRIASVALKKPAFRGVRLEDGSIALPAELAAGAGAEGEPAAADAPATEETAEVVAAGGEVATESDGAAMPGIELAKVRLTDGSLRIVDRAVRPEAKPGLKTFRLSLDGVRLPQRQIDNLHFKGVGLRGGLLEAKGKLAGEATDIVLTVEKYRLVPYDPYAVTFSGYGIRRGMLSIESKVRLEGDDFDTHTNVVVHQLGLKNTSGTTEFEDQIGVPLSLALALLKDAQGDIKLDVPVSGNSQQTNIGIGGIVAQQLKRILVNALTSPLKLFGAVAGGDQVGDFSAARIALAEGKPALSEKGRAQTEQLAELLRDRPELAVHLDVKNSLGDVRALQAAMLLDELRSRESLEGDFAAIRSYLEARSSGGETELPYHLEPILEEMLSRRRPAKSELEALSASRLEVVRDLMTGELQVRPEQVLVEDQSSRDFVDGPAVVEAELGVVDEGEEDFADDEEESIG
jgi:hypothetical protein